MKRLALLVAVALGGCASLPQGAPGAAGAPPMAARPAALSEPHRPLWHYTPPAGWMNDPNGMVYADGVWHLYYQYYPRDTVWGPMHWGHAESRDLVNWSTQPIALVPGPEGYIFSGSAVRANGGITAIYTIHDPKLELNDKGDDESQGIATSHDGGRSFVKYAGNPVLPNPGGLPDIRDPSVFRDSARNQWVMALSVKDHVRFYASLDLKAWRYLSSFGFGVGGHDGVWECPNLFPLRDIATGRTRWVLIQNLNPGGPQGGSGTQYFVGDWDGTRFTLDPGFAMRIASEGPAWLDLGPDNYAGVTWNDAPGGRRVFIGWMSNWLYAQKVPTKAWRSAMTAPRELTLSGFDLIQQPVPELRSLRGDAIALPRHGKGLEAPFGLLPSAEMVLGFELPRGGHFTVTLANPRGEKLTLGLDAQNRWFIDRRQAGPARFAADFAAIHRATRKRAGESARLRLLIDRGSVELFADDGATVMTTTFFPCEDFTALGVSEHGNARLTTATAWRLAANKDAIR